MFVNENYKRTKYICFQWDQGYQTLLIIFWVLSSSADCLLVTMKVLASPPVIFGSRYRSLPIISSQKRSDVEEYFYVLCWWHHRIIESHGCGWTDGCCINPGILNRIFNLIPQIRWLSFETHRINTEVSPTIILMSSGSKILCSWSRSVAPVARAWWGGRAECSRSTWTPPGQTR